MKTKIFTLMLLLGIGSSYKSQTRKLISNPVGAELQRTCGTPILSQQFEAYVQKWINNLSQQKAQAINFTLPVVVHVIHTGQPVGTGANLSNAQIVSQITVLNQDFAGLNPDTTLIPGTFVPNFAHCGISFCLAKADTNGIVMTEPGVDRINALVMGGIAGPYSKGYVNDTIKPNTIWNPNKYLNIWCLDLGGGLLGYATFPDSALTGLGGLGGYNPSQSDGVVIANTAFGNIGALNASYDKGRTATHEVGHWLGLRHIWGDGSCATDYVTDTPPAQGANYGCKTHPWKQGVCAGNANGEMFMNYMDYGNDTCLQMFSNDQKIRMTAILTGSPMRMNLAASNKCSLPLGISQYWNDVNVKLYPHPNNGEFTISLGNHTEKTYLEVYNNLGQLISAHLLSGVTNKVNLTSEAPGIYQVRIVQCGNVIYRTKLVKE